MHTTSSYYLYNDLLVVGELVVQLELPCPCLQPCVTVYCTHSIDTDRLPGKQVSLRLGVSLNITARITALMIILRNCVSNRWTVE